MQKLIPKTKDEAIQHAIDWQNWVSEQNPIGQQPTLYQSDLIEWQEHFEKIAKWFGLEDEFRENGII